MKKSTLKTDKYRLSAEQVRRVCFPKDLKGDAPLKIPIELVGQERAKRALELVLSSANNFHLIIVAENFPAKVIRDFCIGKLKERKEAGESFPLKDFCYVYNFEDPGTPLLLNFAAGKGETFKERVEEIPSRLQLLAQNLYSEKIEKIEQKVFKETKADFEEVFEKLKRDGLVQKWEARGWKISLYADEEEKMVGISWGPVKENGAIITDPEEEKQYCAQLPPEKKSGYEKNREDIMAEAKTVNELSDCVSQKSKAGMAKKSEKLENEICEKALHIVFKKLFLYYIKERKIINFLTPLRNYAYEQRDALILSATRKKEAAKESENSQQDPEILLPFQINLFVNNKLSDSPPVLAEASPTYSELFGKIEREIVFGNFEIKTDHTLIKPGAFHKASGGLVIIDLTDIMVTKEPVYLGLKRILAENQTRIRDPNDEYGVSSGIKTLYPEPFPLGLKIITILHPSIYYHLWRDIFNKNLVKSFEMKAEFGDTVESTPDNIKSYASWMKKYAKTKGFLSLEPKAKAKIIEFLLREAESQNRLLWNVEKVKALIKEAQSYAKEDSQKIIKESDVLKAISEKIYRSSLFEEKVRELIREDVILIETKGERIGQINALTVYALGDYEFGIPSRATATTYIADQEGLVDISRESKLSGKTHTKGVETLKGFLKQRYGQDKNLCCGGRITFEQEYEKTDGASASAAELCAIISSLAEIPIKQNLAITGTIDQIGKIGAIGGVNQKIEGFYEVCKNKRLEGNQGVIIPNTNAKDLMLDEEVVEAVRVGEFHIYAVEKFEEAIEILTGKPVEEIDKLVNKKLKKWCEIGKKDESNQS